MTQYSEQQRVIFHFPRDWSWAECVFIPLFTPGGDDKLVKVWDYMAGTVTHVGLAHGGSITSVKICSNNRTLVSTSADGAILCWKFPHPSSP